MPFLKLVNGIVRTFFNLTLSLIGRRGWTTQFVSPVFTIKCAVSERLDISNLHCTFFKPPSYQERGWRSVARSEEGCGYFTDHTVISHLDKNIYFCCRFHVFKEYELCSHSLTFLTYTLRFEASLKPHRTSGAVAVRERNGFEAGSLHPFLGPGRVQKDNWCAHAWLVGQAVAKCEPAFQYAISSAITIQNVFRDIYGSSRFVCILRTFHV